jgi:hypothetical protein
MLFQPKELDGVLLVDKPTDHTSHDVIARLRGILKMRRIGHAGTLDPMATGVLVVLLGKATKASQYLMSLDKEYTGTIKLGSVTNTQDAEGEVLETRPVPALTEADVKATMATFVGDQYQSMVCRSTSRRAKARRLSANRVSSAWRLSISRASSHPKSISCCAARRARTSVQLLMISGRKLAAARTSRRYVAPQRASSRFRSV